MAVTLGITDVSSVQVPRLVSEGTLGLLWLLRAQPPAVWSPLQHAPVLLASRPWKVHGISLQVCVVQVLWGRGVLFLGFNSGLVVQAGAQPSGMVGSQMQWGPDQAKWSLGG